MSRGGARSGRLAEPSPSGEREHTPDNPGASGHDRTAAAPRLRAAAHPGSVADPGTGCSRTRAACSTRRPRPRREPRRGQTLRCLGLPARCPRGTRMTRRTRGWMRHPFRRRVRWLDRAHQQHVPHYPCSAGSRCSRTSFLRSRNSPIHVPRARRARAGGRRSPSGSGRHALLKRRGSPTLSPDRRPACGGRRSRGTPASCSTRSSTPGSFRRSSFGSLLVLG